MQALEDLAPIDQDLFSDSNLFAVADDDIVNHDAGSASRPNPYSAAGSSVVGGPVNIPSVVDESEIPWEDFFCKVCFNSHNKVVILPCHETHIFCKNCLNALQNKRCPLCNAPLEMERILSLPEYEPRALWRGNPVWDSVLGQVFEEIIPLLAESALREQKKLREQNMMGCEDRSSLDFRAKMERKEELQKKIQQITSKIKRDRVLLRCSKCCLPVSILLMVANFVVIIIMGFDMKACGESYCKEEDRKDKDGCLSKFCSGQLGGFVSAIFFLFVINIQILMHGIKCYDDKSFYRETFTDHQHALQRLQDEFAREFGDEAEADDNGGAASSSQPHGGDEV